MQNVFDFLFFYFQNQVMVNMHEQDREGIYPATMVTEQSMSTTYPHIHHITSSRYHTTSPLSSSSSPPKENSHIIKKETIEVTDEESYMSSTNSLLFTRVNFRRPKRLVPDTHKDEHYWVKRRKNNEAARKSREMKRIVDNDLRHHLSALEDDNLEMRNELGVLKRKFRLSTDRVYVGVNEDGELESKPISPKKIPTTESNIIKELNEKDYCLSPASSYPPRESSYQIRTSDPTPSTARNISGSEYTRNFQVQPCENIKDDDFSSYCKRYYQSNEDKSDVISRRALRSLKGPPGLLDLHHKKEPLCRDQSYDSIESFSSNSPFSTPGAPDSSSTTEQHFFYTNPNDTHGLYRVCQDKYSGGSSLTEEKSQSTVDKHHALGEIHSDRYIYKQMAGINILNINKSQAKDGCPQQQKPSNRPSACTSVNPLSHVPKPQPLTIETHRSIKPLQPDTQIKYVPQDKHVSVSNAALICPQESSRRNNDERDIDILAKESVLAYLQNQDDQHSSTAHLSSEQTHTLELQEKLLRLSEEVNQMKKQFCDH